MVDQLMRATAAGGAIRAVGVITTRLVAEARQRHGLSYVATAALGRTMSAGLLLASSMKRMSARVNIRFQGNGPLGTVFVDAGRDGTVRGYVDQPHVELPPNAKGKLDVGQAVGSQGYLYVLRDNGYGYPYASTVELVSGEVGDDIAYYLTTSEQTPSALALGVFLEGGQVRAAGGLLLQILPRSAQNEELIEVLESRVAALSGFTPLLLAGRQLSDIFQELLGDMDLVIFPEVQLVRFHCGCNFDRVLGALKMLGIQELKSMIHQDDGAEVTCHFCSSVFHAQRSHLEQLVQELEREARAKSMR
ncbi:MAG: Hsp33 family molecular chaperone HslO [Gloeomargarita sp. SKYBB_i_bin120]|nr:Hsp33 family molecular chaperone HslO [Gloeomargarita sp. SKYB120]MDW8177613.1 Hsp33 family molecular chaperone HslO [Gloeomargarita sp. SKYBB_i_bin120]